MLEPQKSASDKDCSNFTSDFLSTKMQERVARHLTRVRSTPTSTTRSFDAPTTKEPSLYIYSLKQSTGEYTREESPVEMQRLSDRSREFAPEEEFSESAAAVESKDSAGAQDEINPRTPKIDSVPDFSVVLPVRPTKICDTELQARGTGSDVDGAVGTISEWDEIFRREMWPHFGKAPVDIRDSLKKARDELLSNTTDSLATSYETKHWWQSLPRRIAMTLQRNRVDNDDTLQSPESDNRNKNDATNRFVVSDEKSAARNTQLQSVVVEGNSVKDNARSLPRNNEATVQSTKINSVKVKSVVKARPSSTTINIPEDPEHSPRDHAEDSSKTGAVPLDQFLVGSSASQSPRKALLSVPVTRTSFRYGVKQFEKTDSPRRQVNIDASERRFQKELRKLYKERQTSSRFKNRSKLFLYGIEYKIYKTIIMRDLKEGNLYQSSTSVKAKPKKKTETEKTIKTTEETETQNKTEAEEETEAQQQSETSKEIVDGAIAEPTNLKAEFDKLQLSCKVSQDNPSGSPDDDFLTNRPTASNQ